MTPDTPTPAEPLEQALRMIYAAKTIGDARAIVVSALAGEIMRKTGWTKTFDEAVAGLSGETAQPATPDLDRDIQELRQELLGDPKPRTVEPVRTYQDQITAEQEVIAWVEAMVPTDRHALFWRVERKQFAQPSEGGSVTVVRAHNRVVATAICIRDDFNRTNLIRWRATQPATHVALTDAARRALEDLETATSFTSRKSRDRHAETIAALRAALATQVAFSSSNASNTLGDALRPGLSVADAPTIPVATGDGQSI